MTAAVVAGAGLAGCEAAWQLAKRGIPVTLYEMKPSKMSPAHQSPLFAELVCSNSLRSNRLQNAVGLLKEEMRRMDSLIMRAADSHSVPAGGALAVDRTGFSEMITQTVQNHPLITVREEELTELPSSPAVIATGPLTSDAMAEKISSLPGMSALHFYDAAAPIVTTQSLNMDKIFRASRYDRGEDYLNCPMNKEQYLRFVDALLSAETAPVHGFEEKKVFEGCMPVESMARRGLMTLAFGPLKPKGLKDPQTGKMPFAVVQLRQDDAANTLVNLVGFQTRLKFPEQKRVFGLIPGLENAEYVRYGVMHRNTFLHSPGFLTDHFECIGRENLFFAGQMTGVEGYVESAASGLVCGVSLAMRIMGKKMPVFGRETAMGALGCYVAAANRNFQPMNITFDLMEHAPEIIRKKEERAEYVSEKALAHIEQISCACAVS